MPRYPTEQQRIESLYLARLHNPVLAVMLEKMYERMPQPTQPVQGNSLEQRLSQLPQPKPSLSNARLAEAIKLSGITTQAISAKANVPETRILGAKSRGGQLKPQEQQRLAAALGVDKSLLFPDRGAAEYPTAPDYQGNTGLFGNTEAETARINAERQPNAGLNLRD